MQACNYRLGGPVGEINDSDIPGRFAELGASDVQIAATLNVETREALSQPPRQTPARRGN